MTEINLLEETERALACYNKTWDDIFWIGGHDFYISVEQFKEAAKTLIMIVVMVVKKLQ